MADSSPSCRQARQPLNVVDNGVPDMLDGKKTLKACRNVEFRREFQPYCQQRATVDGDLFFDADKTEELHARPAATSIDLGHNICETVSRGNFQRRADGNRHFPAVPFSRVFRWPRKPKDAHRRASSSKAFFPAIDRSSPCPARGVGKE